MKLNKKKIIKRKISFDYKSLNPFYQSEEKIRIGERKHLVNENEWLIEYESIYRSYQLDR